MLHEMIHSTRDKLERSARELLHGSALFYPLRTAYQLVFNRQKRLFRRKMREFYAPFVRRGSLVFDVGANVGMYSEVFSELGAQVVAVEPNPEFCKNLRRLARVFPVHVENCAAGDQPGKATLHICNYGGLSTLRNDWSEAIQHSPFPRDAKWIGTREVEIITLDQLAGRYGVPNFVKIDAEGYDDVVLRGMSFRPSALSFEFLRGIPSAAMRCFDAPALASGYEFNYVRGLEMRLSSDCWMRADELRGRLDALAGDTDYGDVLARRTG
jgi:FkbM family methyltransferase